jgi:hypothetical protein
VKLLGSVGAREDRREGGARLEKADRREVLAEGTKGAEGERGEMDERTDTDGVEEAKGGGGVK